MTKVYMITYDLNNPGQSYEKVIEAIKSASTGIWCTFWKSSYLIKSNLTPDEIINKINPHLDTNDRIIAIEVIKNYQGLLNEKEWEYIRNNIF